MTTTATPSAVNVAVHGMGYVGCVSACCLARSGYKVVGVEVVPEKVRLLSAGKIPFLEPGLPELALDMVRAGRLRATTRLAEAIAECDVSLICVGTPPLEDGSPDLSRVFQVCRDLGRALRDKRETHDVVIRSTVLPGTADECVRILQRESGGREGEKFRLFVNPEFLREGSALDDYQNPPFTIIGSVDGSDSARVCRLYAGLAAPLIEVHRGEAELIKFASNVFHALKVVFANELGRLAQASGVDGQRVMEIFCRDEKLNLSKMYLRPGFAFGGSCLPKDLSALLSYGDRLGLDLPLLAGIKRSNDRQIEIGLELIRAQGKRQVALFGVSFKPGTDDLRGSPLVLLAERLLATGHEVRIVDDNVHVAQLAGENKKFVERHLPRFAALHTADLAATLDWAECLVIGHKTPTTQQVVADARPAQAVVDLVRVSELVQTRASYQGLGWAYANGNQPPDSPSALM